MKTKEKRVAIPGVLVLLTILVISIIPTISPIPTAIADGGSTDIDIFAYTNNTLNMDIYCTMVNGTIQIWYNGVNLIEELHEKDLAYARLQQAFSAFVAYSAGAQDVKDLKKALETFRNETYWNLDQLYYRDWLLSHFMGVNPANSTIAITILSGNSTVINELDVNRMRILQLENGVTVLTNDFESTKGEISDLIVSLNSVIPSIEHSIEQVGQEVSQETETRYIADTHLQAYIDEYKAKADEALSVLGTNLQTAMLIAVAAVLMAGALAVLYVRTAGKSAELEEFKTDLLKYAPDIEAQIEKGKEAEEARLEAERKAKEEAVRAEAERRAKEAAAKSEVALKTTGRDEERRARLKAKGLLPCSHCDKVAFNENALARHVRKEHPSEAHPDPDKDVH